MTSTLLIGGKVLCLGQTDRIYDAGFVLIENGRIEAVGDAKTWNDRRSVDERVDCTGKLIMPGLVNAHTHTPMTLFRGLAEGVSLLTMDGWYNTIRLLELVMTPDMIPASVAVACGEMIRTGTTTFADQYFYMDQIIPVVKQSKLRAVLAYGVVELNDPIAREQELTHLDAFLEDMGEVDSDRINGWIGPHAFFVDNSPETMLVEKSLAQKYGAGLHIHISTTGEEDEFCQTHLGMSAVQKMDALGMLEERIIAAHALSIPEADWSLLAQKPFTTLICPSAGMRAGAGSAPVVGMRQAGINIALGSDNVCNNNDYDLFLEMRTLGKLSSYREGRPGALPARDIVDIATAGGARALGLDDQIGELSIGRQADIILLDMEEIGWGPTPANDVFTALVYSINGLHVTDSMVGGDWVLRHRQWQTVDYKSARKQQHLDAERLLALRTQL